MIVLLFFCGGRVTRDEIFTLLRERIIRFIQSRMGPEVALEAEDLAHDAIVLIEEKYPDVAPLEDLVRLGIRIVLYIQSDRNRRKWRIAGNIDDFEPVDPGQRADKMLEMEQLASQLAEAIKHLNLECRKLIGFRLSGMSTAEIRLKFPQLPPQTIDVRIHRCYNGLRKLMGQPKEKRR
jgi:DNA-directed RNA polymerase specialized sigma24 family protein